MMFHLSTFGCLSVTTVRPICDRHLRCCSIQSGLNHATPVIPRRCHFYRVSMLIPLITWDINDLNVSLNWKTTGLFKFQRLSSALQLNLCCGTTLIRALQKDFR